MKRVIFSCCLLVLLSCCTCHAQSDSWLKLGVIPYKSPREIIKLYNPVANVLAKTLGKNVRIVTADDFDQYMQRVYENQYDIIALGSSFYFKAHDKAGYLAVARGFPSFRCGIVVRRDSGIHTINQLRGKSMAATNNKDRGGYKLQKMALLQNGIDVEYDLDVHFRGNHDSIMYAVLNGQDDAGAIRLDILQKPVFSELINQIEVIYTSPEIPQFPFAVRQDLDPLLQEKIATALTSITLQNPETAAILQRLHISGFERITCRDMEMLQLARKQKME